MLGRKGKKGAPITTLIGSDTRIKGDVDFVGGCLVDGQVVGNVTAGTAGKDEESTLNVSERGRIEGTVSVPHITLNGTVEGDVRAAQRIELGPRSRVLGNVRYRLIEMAIGAEVNGKLVHESESTSAGASASEGVASAAVSPEKPAVKAIGE